MELYKIFENMPTDTVIYSPMYGECFFVSVNRNEGIKIRYIDSNFHTNYQCFDADFGCVKNCKKGKIMLFPKENVHNWDHWQSYLFKAGDYITNMITDDTFIYIGYNKMYDCYGQEHTTNMIESFNYAYDSNKRKYTETLEDAGFRWVPESGKMGVIVSNPRFKVNDIVKFKDNYLKSHAVSNCELVIGKVTPSKYVFNNDTTLSISEQDNLRYVGTYPKFTKGDIIKNKESKKYYRITDVTDRGYALSGCHPFVLFEWQDNYEKLERIGLDYCSYEVCKLFVKYGFRFLAYELEKYGAYVGDGGPIKFHGFTDKDIPRIPMSIGKKWLSAITGLEIGVNEMIDKATGEISYVPFVGEVLPMGIAKDSPMCMQNCMSFKEAIASKDKAEATECAIKYVLNNFLSTLG